MREKRNIPNEELLHEIENLQSFLIIIHERIVKMGINYDAWGFFGMTLALSGVIAWLQLLDWLFLLVVLVGFIIMIFFLIQNVRSYYEIKKIDRRINFLIEQIALREHVWGQHKKSNEENHIKDEF